MKHSRSQSCAALVTHPSSLLPHHFSLITHHLSLITSPSSLITSHFSLITFLFSLLISLASSCTTDVYDKGNGEYSLMQAELTEVHIGNDLQADYFITDDGERLAVTNKFMSNWMKTPDSIYRAVTFFNRNAAGAEVKGLNRVGVTVPKKINDLKTDPVRFESIWMSHSGKYLNVSIYLLLGTTDDDKAIQMLGCHSDTLLTATNGKTTQRLTLYHDQGGVPEYYSQRTYISIPLDNITADSVALTIHTYDGKVVEKTFACK